MMLEVNTPGGGCTARMTAALCAESCGWVIRCVEKGVEVTLDSWDGTVCEGPPMFVEEVGLDSVGNGDPSGIFKQQRM